ncbi:MAG TPA: DUF397 domain-containing protein [Streptosporangiaceae bacterium]|nr:DUF397 domain-containing protein [Streptosporangiaceae bacterium]
MDNGLMWRKLCDSNACVEIAVQGDAVLMRNSLAPEEIVALTRIEWQEFLGQAKQGLLDAY